MRAVLFAVIVLAAPFAEAEEHSSGASNPGTERRTTGEDTLPAIEITSDKVPPPKLVLTRSKHVKQDIERAADHVDDAVRRVR